jgi:hypothetical protein
MKLNGRKMNPFNSFRNTKNNLISNLVKEIKEFKDPSENMTGIPLDYES